METRQTQSLRHFGLAPKGAVLQRLWGRSSLQRARRNESEHVLTVREREMDVAGHEANLEQGTDKDRLPVPRGGAVRREGTMGFSAQ